jgi:hypothetical protein
MKRNATWKQHACQEQADATTTKEVMDVLWHKNKMKNTRGTSNME